MDNIECNGNTIEQLPDDGMKITTLDGKTFMLDKDGNVEVNCVTIKSVGFENIFDFKSYVMMQEGELIVHKAEFHNGGNIKIIYTTQGKLVEFSGNKICQTITKEGAIIIRRLNTIADNI